MHVPHSCSFPAGNSVRGRNCLQYLHVAVLASDAGSSPFPFDEVEATAALFASVAVPDPVCSAVLLPVRFVWHSLQKRSISSATTVSQSWSCPLCGNSDSLRSTSSFHRSEQPRQYSGMSSGHVSLFLFVEGRNFFHSVSRSFCSISPRWNLSRSTGPGKSPMENKVGA